MKMNYLTVFIACATLLTTTTAIDDHQLKEFITQLRAADKSCNEDPATQIDLEELRNMHSGGPKPENLDAHVDCLAKFLGLVNPDGSINDDALRSKLQGIFGNSLNVDKIISECSQPQANIGESAQCIMNHLPIPRGSFHQ